MEKGCRLYLDENLSKNEGKGIQVNAGKPIQYCKVKI